MNPNFIPHTNPPKNKDLHALYFCFFEKKLLIRLVEDKAEVVNRSFTLKSDLKIQSEHFLGNCDQLGEIYAVELAQEPKLDEGYFLSNIREISLKLGPHLFQIAGRAIQIINWSNSHNFCSKCGSKTFPLEDERAKKCPECNSSYYPRITPAVIMRIEKDDTILMANNINFEKDFYSVLAGFVEAGESLEETVAREVKEEVGIEIEDIRYFGSQPWPFPHSLMIAFTAKYKSGEIKVQTSELRDARWYSREELPENYKSLSIGRKLINDFLNNGPRHSANLSK